MVSSESSKFEGQSNRLANKLSSDSNNYVVSLRTYSLHLCHPRPKTEELPRQGKCQSSHPLDSGYSISFCARLRDAKVMAEFRVI